MPSLFHGPEVLSSASDEVKLFARNSSKMTLVYLCNSQDG